MDLVPTPATATSTKASLIDVFFKDVVVPFYRLLIGLLKHLWILRIFKYIAHLLTPRRFRDWWASEVKRSKVIAKVQEVLQWIDGFGDPPHNQVISKLPVMTFTVTNEFLGRVVG